MKKAIMLTCLLITMVTVFPGLAQADLLDQKSITMSSACMVSSAGDAWTGGAAGVQGPLAINGTAGGHALAANVTFKYNIGATIDALNASYGAGNWTIANPTLYLQYTLYANNSRFNEGAGTFDILWVANDTWVAGSATPAFATSAATLSTWAGSLSILGSEYYNWSTPTITGSIADALANGWSTDKSGPRQSTQTYSLDLSALFLNDILSATAASNQYVSLYLMATSDTMGMTIFTGGASIVPTLSFDVVTAAPVPLPPGLWLLGPALAGLVGMRRRLLKK
jgi:hypothetical protein